MVDQQLRIPPLTNRISTTSRRVLPTLVAAVVALTAACSSSNLPPRTNSQSHQLPAVLVSAERSTATVLFSLEATELHDTIATSISLSYFEVLMDVVVRHNGEEVVLTNRRFECSGPECVGDYEIEANWIGNDTGDGTFGTGISTEIEYKPPDHRSIDVTDLQIEADAVVLAQGELEREGRSWIALRAYNGLTNLDRFAVQRVVGFDDIRVVTNDNVYLPPSEKREQRISLPESCLENACGTAVRIEKSIGEGQTPLGTVKWRLLDHDPNGEPIRIEQETESVATISGRTVIHLDDVVALPDIDERTFRVVVPESVMEGSNPDRPVYLSITIEASSDSDLLKPPKISATDVSGMTSSVSYQHPNILPTALCHNESTCDAEFRIQTRRPAGDGQVGTATARISVTATLPHLTVQPTTGTVDIVEVP